MQLEAIGKPIKFRLITGEEITLMPGAPIDLPEDRARKLLAKAPGKVRVRATHEEWLAAWRAVEVITRAITSRDDPWFPFVMAAIEFCDEFFLADDWAGFQRAITELRNVIAGKYPAAKERTK